MITAIDGTAGIGKTALAVHWAHQVADRFPDGQLYVNLRGFDPAGAPVAPAEVLYGFLDALGVPPAQVPAGVEAQSAWYRSLLAGRRMLVLLDNARDAGQVRPLLPGSPGCLVLVTSRAPLLSLIASQGAHSLTLDLLTVAEGRELLTRRLGADRVNREPHAADDLIELCARLPLALNIAAARAATNPAPSLAELVDQLRHAQRRLDVLDTGDPVTDVRAVFSWSVRGLSPPTARMFRLIGRIAPGPDISGPAAASLAGLPLGSAHQALRELTTARLLTEQPPGRYSFHDLLREHAAELSKETDSAEESQAALARVLGWYREQAVNAAAVLAPNGRLPICVSAHTGAPVVTGPAQALAWFETERANLVAGVQRAAEAGFDEIAAHVAAGMWDYFQRTPHVEDWLLTSEIGVRSARRIGGDALLGWLLNGLGQAHSQLGHFGESSGYLFEALDIRRRIGDRTGEGTVLNALAIDLYYQERFEDALEYLRPALVIHTALGARSYAATTLNNIGEMLLRLERHDEALYHLKQALVIQAEAGDRYGEGITESTLGHTYLDLGRYQDAVDHYRRALAALDGTARDHKGQAGVLYGMGRALQSLSRTREAREAWQAAIPLLDRNHDPRAAELRARLTAHR